MGKKRKQKNKNVETAQSVESATIPDTSGPICPICKIALSPGTHFACPACGMEIDYLLAVKIQDVPTPQVAQIQQGHREIWHNTLLAVCVYAVVWFLLYHFILAHHVTGLIR